MKTYHFRIILHCSLGVLLDRYGCKSRPLYICNYFLRGQGNSFNHWSSLGDWEIRLEFSRLSYSQEFWIIIKKKIAFFQQKYHIAVNTQKHLVIRIEHKLSLYIA